MRRVGTSNDELDNTAQFKSESPKQSSRSLQLSLEDIPRVATSFLHAFMQTYDVDEQKRTIIFPDYLEQSKVCIMQLPIVQDWIVKIRTAGGIVSVGPDQKDADQRDLQHACAKLGIFLRGTDLLPDHVVESRIT